MLSRRVLFLATITSFVVVDVVDVVGAAAAAAAAATATSGDLDSGDYDALADDEGKSHGDLAANEVRCYCNQPECVPQGYMCRGKVCFTELPSGTNPSVLRVEHSTYSGCLEESYTVQQCPTGFLCCKQDLCNHVDSPAMRSRLNKTLQVLIGEQRGYLGPVRSIDDGGASTADGWFKTATIAVPICGLIVLLILASLAIRLLQPVPTQADKLGVHGSPDNGPPLLGSPKVPLV